MTPMAQKCLRAFIKDQKNWFVPPPYNAAFLAQKLSVARCFEVTEAVLVIKSLSDKMIESDDANKTLAFLPSPICVIEHKNGAVFEGQDTAYPEILADMLVIIS